jgi:pentapeptide MXKDX repeat protein
MNTRSRVVPIAAVLAVSAALLFAPDSSAQDKMKDSMGKGDMMKKDEMQKDTMGKGETKKDEKMMKKDDKMMKKEEMKK